MVTTDLESSEYSDNTQKRYDKLKDALSNCTVTVNKINGTYFGSIYTPSHGYHPLQQPSIISVKIGGGTV